MPDSSDHPFLAQLIDHLPTGIAIVQGEKVVYANKTWKQQVGDQEDAKIPSPMPLIHTDDDQAAKAFLKNAQQEPTDPSVFRFQNQQGGYTHLELAASVPKPVNNRPAIIISSRDLSHQRKIEGHLRIAERMASIGTLAAGMAHEINNPLTFVVGNLDLADRSMREIENAHVRQGVHVPAVDGLHQAFADVRSGVGRVRRIVSDMRAFSRDDDEKPRVIDVRTLLTSTIKMAANELRFRGRLETDFRYTPPVNAIEARLGQVFLNLIVNAAHALPEDTREDNWVKVSTRENATGNVEVTVVDNGVGIKPDDLNQVFDPFFTTKPPGMGSGLGLSICHSLLNGMGGQISIKSVLGEGTTATVELPSATFTDSEKTQRVPRFAPQSHLRRRVLIVDDEPLVLRMLKKALRDHDITVANNGQDAIRLTQETEFDVILCDLMMPNMDGVQIYESIQMRDPRLAKKVVFMTGGAFTPRSRKFLSQIENQCIKKPFEASEILAFIQQTTAKKMS
mgnify:CR=1 FL=1